MKLTEMYPYAKLNMTICRMCKTCNGEACRGLTPGCGGKGSGETFVRNVADLKKVTIRMQVLRDDYDVDTSFDFFGHQLKAPIFAAPVTNYKGNYGTSISETQIDQALCQGCDDEGIMAFMGDCPIDALVQDGFDALESVQGRGVFTVKPWRNDLTISKIKSVNKVGCEIIAMDADAAGLVHMKNTPTPLGFKNISDLKEIRAAITGKFIVKGIMTIEDAMIALEAGVDGIVISNHGGRVMDDGESTISVLESISTAVAGRMMVLVDGGFRSGSDVFKALALGADGVLIGRPYSHAAIGGGREGVGLYSAKIINELAEVMRLAGTQTLSDIKLTTVKTDFR